MCVILKNAKRQNQKFEVSRIGYTMLAEADAELRNLEARMTTMPLAEFNMCKRAIEERREMLKTQLSKNVGR